MKIVVALGGNAFLRRGEPATLETQRYNVRRAARALAPLAASHAMLVTHGNGPQVGLLELQAAARTSGPPLDVAGAEAEGMIGYLLEQELGNALASRRIATLLTRTEVREDDPAFGTPDKFIGPAYAREEAERLALHRGWRIGVDGQCWRRLVPSPAPINILGLAAIEHLVSGGFLVICAGGGGIPVRRGTGGQLEGVDAVIEKDLAASLLACSVGADCLLLLTDVPGVFDGWGSARARRMRAAHPDALGQYRFDAHSMGPKVEAACRFARQGGRAYIGAIEQAGEILAGTAGTCISGDAAGMAFAA